MGISGILINVLIAKFYSIEILGIFNQLYSLYILFSQLSVFGIHFSMLKNISHYYDESKTKQLIFSSGIYIVCFTSLLTILLCYFSSKLWIIYFHSSGVKEGLIYILPALVFFSLNKTYLAFYNACRRMKAYAFLQAIRYLLLLLFLGILIAFSFDGNKIVIIFALSEFSLSLILFCYTFKYIHFSFSIKNFFWIRKHLSFGSKAVIGNTLADANTRVDVLALGIFTGDKVVGIYSFAAMLWDGYNQLSILVRTNVNPILTRYRFYKKLHEFREAITKGKKLAYKFLIPTGILAIILYPLILYGFQFKAEFTELFHGWAVFAILISGSMISAGYLPFQMILTQIGHPGHQTLFLFFFFITNVILNIIMIPIWGMYGAAIATSLSFVSQIFYLKVLVKRTTGIKI